jgi:hypothetical protein
MAEMIAVHCRCHRMVLPADGGRSALAQGLTRYSMKERVAPFNGLRSFGPVTNQGTVAKYLSPSRNMVSLMSKNPPGPQAMMLGTRGSACCFC